MLRACFIVDGFNLYHSLDQASFDLGLAGAGTKWLDIRALCSSQLPTIRTELKAKGKIAIQSIHYFSAYATHRTDDPDKVSRHRAYTDCLEDSGIHVAMGSFKTKNIACKTCGASWVKAEEKETDVAIAIKVVELAFTGNCDVVVIVSGDTDLAPALRTAKTVNPEMELFCLFPYGRRNDELKALADGSASINRENIKKRQFADPYVCGSGVHISKPHHW